MPPKASNQKRKRGRPPGASRVDQDASDNETPVANDEADAEVQERPRKRGREAKAEDVGLAASSASQNGPAQPARRGRPPKTSQQHTATEDLSKQQEKDAGRRAKNTVKKGMETSEGKENAAQSHDAQAGEETPGSEPRRSGRERRRWNPDEVFGSNRPTPLKQDETSSPDPRRSARERRARGLDNTPSGGRQSDGYEAQPTPVAEKARPRKRTGSSPKEGAAPKTQKQGRDAATGKTEPRRGRPPLGDKVSGEGRALQPQQGNMTKVPGGGGSQPRRRGRPRASDGPPPPPKRKQSQPRRPEAVSEEAESSGPEEEDSELPFRHIREATRNIPRTTISEKWTPLDGPSINAVGAFIADAQRTVLLRLQDTNRRREHASSALSVISRRLRSKLVKGFPFPAPTAGAPSRAGLGSHADEFDFERTVDTMQALESTLNPLQHSVGLLEREIRKEEDALAKDYGSLHGLEANARSEAKRWREQAKREHVLAPSIRTKGEGGGDGGSRGGLELVPRAEDDAPGALFAGLQDEELVTLSKQIGSHMESMKGNLQQIGGVLPAVAKSKAALQQVLLKHLDDEGYERVLVG